MNACCQQWSHAFSRHDGCSKDEEQCAVLYWLLVLELLASASVNFVKRIILQYVKA